MNLTQRKALLRLGAGILFSLGLTPFAGCEGYIVVDCSGAKAGDNGLVDCGGLVEVRPNPTICDLPGPGDQSACTGTDLCTTDADCNLGANGRCNPGAYGQCACTYGCDSDADCGPGYVCYCGEKGGMCAIADCATSADCPEGQSCALYFYEPECDNYRLPGFACTTDHDQCLNDQQCNAGDICVAAGGSFVCTVAGCPVGGRPFYVAEELRVAEIVRSRDWGSALRPDVGSLTPAAREAMAKRWTEVGQLEHASVASFARFALQLLSLGAPPDLVEQTTSAMADETLHARLSFGLASAFAGVFVGPGDLKVAGAMESSGVAAIVSTLIQEGCVGETFASIVAREELERAQDPVVREVLSRIIEDEERHALLAWRALSWLLDRGGDVARDALSVETRRIAAEVAAGRGEWQSRGEEDRSAMESGTLTAGEMGSLRAAVLKDVYLPAARALLAKTAKDETIARPIAAVRA